MNSGFNRRDKKQRSETKTRARTAGAALPYPQDFLPYPPNVFQHHSFTAFMMQGYWPPQQNPHPIRAPENVIQQGDVGFEKDAEEGNDFVAEIDPAEVASQSKKSWSIPEDAALISSFMNCTDPITGTFQKFSGLWRKVWQGYKLAQQSQPDRISIRNQESIRGRWRRICGAVSKWVGCIEEATSQKKIGMNEEDCIREAHIIYAYTYRVKFLFYAQWKMLEKYPMWVTVVRSCADPSPQQPRTPSDNTGSGGKRMRLIDDDDAVFSTPPTGGLSTNEDTAEFGSSNRAPGVKGAKQKKGKRKVVGESSNDGELSMEFDQYASAIKERVKLEDKKIKGQAFNTLLAKGVENLSELEKKLFTQLALDLGFDI